MAEAIKMAFCRVEGTLVGRPAVAAAAWMAANAQEIGQRVTGLGGAAVAAGMRLDGGLAARQMTQRVAWMGLRAMSRDRLEVLGREYWERFIEPKLLDVGLELLAEAHRRGHHIVLLSDHLDVIIGPLAERVCADEVIANRLEMRGDAATGRLEEPIIGGHLSGQWARGWAASRAVDLADALGYGARAADCTLLSALGHPCAVNPDRQLRQIARDLGWPIVER